MTAEKVSYSLANDDKGEDSEGREFRSIEEMWQKELGNDAGKEKEGKKWYEKSASYWEKVEPTVNGMLGGFPEISETDMRGSRSFIARWLEGSRLSPEGHRVCVDCGAGIGRITKGVLMKKYDKVDMVEKIPSFLEAAKNSMNENELKKIGDSFAVGLEDFHPREGYYDTIWIQWVVIYLPDNDLVAFLKRCIKGLKPHGVIVVKDNVTRPGVGFQVDNDDASVTRSDFHMKDIFGHAGLRILAEEVQKGFPAGLYPVKTYALIPRLE